jgi:hypothetical protein
MPFVRENRNLLLVRPESLPDDPREQERFLYSLLYALKQGIEHEFDVEPGEMAAELIGDGEHRHLMFFETAEGGVGAAERLLREPDSRAWPTAPWRSHISQSAVTTRVLKSARPPATSVYWPMRISRITT